MCCVHARPIGISESDLERVIEPLASYLCASDRPQAALKFAMTVLLREVRETSRAARARVAAFCESSLAAPA